MAESKLAPRKGRAKAEEEGDLRLTPEPTEAVMIAAYEDDPEPGVLVTLPVPDPGKAPLAYNFRDRAPKPGSYRPGTAEFRYWNAAAALRRGADFWASRVPSGAWQPGPVLGVILDEGVDLNAFYDRQALNFFHGPSPTGTVFSGESPDILCHEMGHAILDSIKPQLWDAASHEPPAFHEAFGDMSAMLAALQLPSLRAAVLSETGGHLYHNSRLSRLAEQLGSAIRAQAPDAVDRDCLRNAVNSFTYQDPVRLPPSAPASMLSSEPHSFSRVFTGAFLESLAGFLAAIAADPNAPTEAELQVVSEHMADILVAGVRAAPVVPNFYAQVAAAMVRASGSINPAYPGVLNAVFADRGILSIQSVMAIETFQTAAAEVAGLRMGVAGPVPQAADAPLTRFALAMAHPGLDGRPLIVQAASHARRFAATAAANDFGSLEPVSSETAARAFVEELFRRRKVDYARAGGPAARHVHARGVKTHRVVEADGALVLERRLFDCGLRHR